MNNLYSGRYSIEEINEIKQINLRPQQQMSYERPFYKKNATEHGPTWAQRRKYVEYLMNDSNMEPYPKEYLKEQFKNIENYQMKGFKYGIATSLATFFFFPVIRRQPFLKRVAICSLPFLFCAKWGYTWGHERWWRMSYEIVMTKEMFDGNRHRYSMK